MTTSAEDTKPSTAAEPAQVEVASLPVFQFGQDQWSFVGSQIEPITEATEQLEETTEQLTAETKEFQETPVYDQLAEDIMAPEHEPCTDADSGEPEESNEHSADGLTTSDKSDAMVLPLTLCDETLLEEIQNIPERMGFKIGEVAEMISIKNYVLRYWESEFEILKPRKSSNNQRVYSRRDVENAFLIRKLLHRDRFSIEGAKQALKDLKVQVRKEQKVQATYHKIENKIESFHERVESLIEDVRKLRKIINHS